VGRLVAIVGLAAGLAGLALQFSISIPASLETGRGLGGALVWFFSFFTILTNIAAILVYAAALIGTPAWFGRSGVRAGVAVAMAVVGIVYATVLAQLWQPRGLFLIADTTLHYVTPALFTLWWLTVGRNGASRLADIPLWLIYPLAYLGWVLARGAFVTEYPYPFLDLNVKSPYQVAQSSLMMLCLFLVVSLAAVAADRFLPKTPGMRTA